MIKSVKLDLSGGDFEIAYGSDFSVASDVLNHLVYEKDGVWHVVSDPCRGRYANTVITLPYERSFHNFALNIKDGAVKMCKTECDNISLEIKSSSVEIEKINSQELYISMSRGNLQINADSAYTDIDCGYGTVDIRMQRRKDGYAVTSQCGMGNVTLNSSILPKKYQSDNSERKINVICGMGDVNIST